MTDRPTRLGVLLYQWRSLRRLTVRQSAKEIGISYATLSRVERGYAMELATWRKIEDWLLETPDEP